MKHNDEYFMEKAINESLKSAQNGEVPVGVVMVENNKIISKGHNMIEKKHNSTMHAEIIAISKASKKKKNWRLDNCILYTTMEPCMMCCGAIMQSRIKKIVYGIQNKQYGHTKYLKNVEIVKEISKEKCREIVQMFFKNIR